jgi:amidohydrolase
VPGLFVFLGGTPVGQDAARAPSNHSPRFSIDESALKLGVRTLLHMTADYMSAR